MSVRDSARYQKRQMLRPPAAKCSRAFAAACAARRYACRPLMSGASAADKSTAATPREMPYAAANDMRDTG